MGFCSNKPKVDQLMRKRVMKAREKDVPDKDDHFFQLKKRVERERQRERGGIKSIIMSCTGTHVWCLWCGWWVLWVPKTHEELHLGPILCYLFGERERERESCFGFSFGFGIGVGFGFGFAWLSVALWYRYVCTKIKSNNLLRILSKLN